MKPEFYLGKFNIFKREENREGVLRQDSCGAVPLSLLVILNSVKFHERNPGSSSSPALYLAFNFRSIWKRELPNTQCLSRDQQVKFQ